MAESQKDQKDQTFDVFDPKNYYHGDPALSGDPDCPRFYTSRSPALQSWKHKAYNRMDQLIKDIETFDPADKKQPFYMGRDTFVRDALRDLEGIVWGLATAHKGEMSKVRETAFAAKHGRDSASVREAYLERLDALAKQDSGHHVYVQGWNPQGKHHYNIPTQKYEEAQPTEIELDAFRVTGERCRIEKERSVAGWH